VEYRPPSNDCRVYERERRVVVNSADDEAVAIDVQLALDSTRNIDRGMERDVAHRPHVQPQELHLRLRSLLEA
jgi:hypothetical protein